MATKLFAPKAHKVWEYVNFIQHDICYFSIVQKKSVDLVEYLNSLWTISEPNYYFTLEVKLYVHFKDVFDEDS